MVAMETIKFARTMGYDTVKELNALKKGVKSGQPVTRAHLDVVSPDAFLSTMSKENSFVQPLYDLAKKVFPRAYAPDVKTGVDVEVKKLGAKSSTVKVSSISKDSKGVVGQSKVVLKGNESGVRFDIVGTAEGSTVDYRGTFLRNAKHSTFDENENLVKGLKYTEEGGMSDIAVSTKRLGPVRNFDARIVVPTEYLDGITREMGVEKSFGETIADYKAMLE